MEKSTFGLAMAADGKNCPTTYHFHRSKETKKPLNSKSTEEEIKRKKQRDKLNLNRPTFITK